MILLMYLQGFTAGYTNEKITQTQFMFLSFIKETNIFLSSDKKNDWAKPPNPNSSHIMYIGFQYVMPSPRKYF